MEKSRLFFGVIKKSGRRNLALVGKMVPDFNEAIMADLADDLVTHPQAKF